MKSLAVEKTHRTFRDRVGAIWRVTEIPARDDSADERERRGSGRSGNRSAPATEQFTTRPHAWLHFESKSERRKVASVPNAWRQLEDADLEDLLSHSTVL